MFIEMVFDMLIYVSSNLKLYFHFIIPFLNEVRTSVTFFARAWRVLNSIASVNHNISGCLFQSEEQNHVEIATDCYSNKIHIRSKIPS